MVFATAILEHEKLVDTVKHHMNYLLAVTDAQERKNHEYAEAKDFYLNLK